MDQVHVGEITVTRILGITEPLALIYHRTKKIVGYILPATQETRELLGIDPETGQEQGEGPCSQHLTSDTEQ